MKTSILMYAVAAGVALAACAGQGGAGGATSGAAGGSGATGATGATAAQGPVAYPGAQPQQAPIIAQQRGPGPALALGEPGAAAAQAAGPAQRQAGEQIATKGGPNGVTACASCHGAQGEGNAASGFPRIAGQSAYYLGKQLAAYANGARVNPVMEPIAKAMNAEQIRDVAAYYASVGGGAAGGAAHAPSGRGRQLADKGDESRRVQACANCHGPGGAGEPPAYPYLAGQHASYLASSLQQWKSGARKTDLSGQMVQIAQALSDADMKALADYFSAQPAPPPATRRVNVPLGSTERPAVAAAQGAPGPRQGGGASSVSSRVGTEQGAPQTGGAQGVGGGGGTQAPQQSPPPPVRR